MAKPRFMGRGRAASSASSLAGSTANLSQASMPGHTLPLGPGQVSRETVDLVVQQVVHAAGEQGLTVNDLTEAYQQRTGRDFNADARAVGYANGDPK